MPCCGGNICCWFLMRSSLSSNLLRSLSWLMRCSSSCLNNASLRWSCMLSGGTETCCAVFVSLLCAKGTYPVPVLGLALTTTFVVCVFAPDVLLALVVKAVAPGSKLALVIIASDSIFAAAGSVFFVGIGGKGKEKLGVVLFRMSLWYSTYMGCLHLPL